MSPSPPVLPPQAFGLTATLDIESIDYNIVEESFDRLDWTQFDFDGDGTNEALNPGAELPTPVDLTIDFTGDFVRPLPVVPPEQEPPPTVMTMPSSLPGDVSLAGTAEFAVTRYERDIEAMTDAQLDGYAFTVDEAQLLIDEDIDLTLSGMHGIVTIAPDEESDAVHRTQDAGCHRHLPMLPPQALELTATLDIESIDYNIVEEASTAWTGLSLILTETEPTKHSTWRTTHPWI